MELLKPANMTLLKFLTSYLLFSYSTTWYIKVSELFLS